MIWSCVTFSSLCRSRTTVSQLDWNSQQLRVSGWIVCGARFELFVTETCGSYLSKNPVLISKDNTSTNMQYWTCGGYVPKWTERFANRFVEFVSSNLNYWMYSVKPAKPHAASTKSSIKFPAVVILFWQSLDCLCGKLNPCGAEEASE